MLSRAKNPLQDLKSGLIWTTRKKCEQNSVDYCITVLLLPAVAVSLQFAHDVRAL